MPAVIAADMLAQAEHDVDATALLITTSETLAHGVQAAIEDSSGRLPTAALPGSRSIATVRIILVPDLDTPCGSANDLRPEHLSLHDASLLDAHSQCRNGFPGRALAGIGGGLCRRTEPCAYHLRLARCEAGCPPADFVKVIAIQELSPEALQELAPADHGAGSRRRTGGARARRGGSICQLIL